MEAEPRAPRDTVASAQGTSTLYTLARHQAGGFLAGVVDFGAMIFGVEALGWSPVVGTAVGATLGAVTNFVLGRTWIFRRHSGQTADQALRYAVVSACSAGLNALGEHLAHNRAHVQYVLARVLVAIAVSILWNFPLHRRFVFRDDSVR